MLYLNITPLMALCETDDLMASAPSLHDTTCDGIVYGSRPYGQCSDDIVTLWPVLHLYMIIPLMTLCGTDDLMASAPPLHDNTSNDIVCGADDLMASALSLHDNTSDGIVWDRRLYRQCSISK